MLYGPSNGASSQTEMLARNPDARITTGQRAPTNPAMALKLPTEMPLALRPPADDEGGARRMTARTRYEWPQTLAEAASLTAAAILRSRTGWLRACWPKRSNQPEYQKEVDLRAVRITRGFSRGGSGSHQPPPAASRG